MTPFWYVQRGVGASAEEVIYCLQSYLMCR